LSWNIPKPTSGKEWEMRIYRKISPDTKSAKILAFLVLPTFAVLVLGQRIGKLVVH